MNRVLSKKKVAQGVDRVEFCLFSFQPVFQFRFRQYNSVEASYGVVAKRKSCLLLCMFCP